MRKAKSNFQKVLQTIRVITLGFLVLLLVNSCRKSELKVTHQSMPTNSAIVDAFLQLPADADPLLIRIINELKKKDVADPFIEKIIVAGGMPRWDYSEIKLPSGTLSDGTIAVNSTGPLPKLQGRQNTNDSTILVPFVKKGVKCVNSFLVIRLADSIQIGLIQGKDFAHFGYKENGKKPTAKSVAMRCMLFDHKIFKHNNYKVIDKQLALAFSGGRDTIGLFVFKNDDLSTSTMNVKPNLSIAVTTCIGGTWEVDPNAPWNTYTQAHPPLVLVGADCNTQWFDFADPSYTEPDFGSTSYSSGGGSGVASAPTSLYSEADRVPEAWEATDADGFYYARMDALQALLDEEAFHITPCDKLNIMPLDDNGPNGYGLMFKRVAQNEVSTEVRTRLNDIATIAPTSIFSTFKVQTLSNAYGPVVNCDYFAVHIDALPTGISAEDLLEIFRKNTNSFIDPALNNSFAPYTDGSFSDAARFNLPFEQSVGALIHLNLLNDGTVVESNYYRTASPFKCRFTYSTISSPLDYNHPVSGNREFGIFANPAGNGYTFYTMGVDRTTDLIFSWGNSRNWGFNAADNLWNSVQTKMAAFVNNNGGQAYKQAPVIARPSWNHVDRYLRGEITFTLLKKLLGC